MTETLNQYIEKAEAAISYAQSVRRLHRRRTPRGSQQRETDLQLAMGRLRDAMRPVRTELGRLPFLPSSESTEQRQESLQEISKALQCERRKLWKMRERAKDEAA